MKDLIAIFNYSPDARRKEILHSFLKEIQPLREKYDLLVVSHSTISDISMELLDFFYLDKNNELITDFSLTNKFWFRSPEFEVNSSLVYPYSTHLAIYTLLYYVFNFAFHFNYNKIHFIEYDLKLKNIDLINQVNRDLDENDGVIFKGHNDWAIGAYFASTLNGYNRETFKYDRESILNQLKESDNRMTERITPIIICKDRKISYRAYQDLNGEEEYQLNDEHKNNTLKWAVPIVLENTNEVKFFIYNEPGDPCIIDLFVNNEHRQYNVERGVGVWNLSSIGNIDEIREILVYVDKILEKKVILNEMNLNDFKKNNYIVNL